VHYLDRLLDERISLTGVITGLGERAASEGRDLTDGERSEVARLQERCVVVDGLLTEHEAQSSSARAFAELQARIEAGRERTSDATVTRSAPGRPQEQRSAGQLVTESTAFQNYSGRGQMTPVEVTDYLSLEQRAVITTAALSIQPFVWQNTINQPPMPLLNLVNHVRVSSGVVEWVEVGPDPVAAVVAEGTAKPEAALTVTPKTSTLDTLAHWIQITRQALADAPYMRSLIEGKLRNGLARKIQADLATLLNGATLQSAVDADMTKAIRKGIALVEGNGYNPNAVLLNPADFAAIDIAAGTTAGYGTGPDRRNTYWGLTAVAVPGLTAGVAIVGDLSEGVTLFDRGVADVFVTDSHASLFINNILVILAETRVKSAITDPLALAETAAA
jgi:HK97 family phage major capsid protein